MPSSPARRRIPGTVLAVLLLAASATGCGGGGSEVAEPKGAERKAAPKPLPTTAGEVEARMLTAEEMPGYRVVEADSWSEPRPPVGTRTFKPRACGVIAQPEGGAGAAVTYEHDGEPQDLHPRDITTTRYAKGEAARWMGELREAEGRCDTFRSESSFGDGVHSDRMTWLPEPDAGDEALRVERVTEDEEEMTLHSLTTYVRTGDLVTAFHHKISYGSAIDKDHLATILPSPDEALVDAQIAKLLGHRSSGR
ncbi:MULTISPECIES: hypothetical protein [Streptomyces]|uniref:hypothetical protein n=1 Tax=Streptomyces TaxID=1883 RepID=UPI00101FA8C4|nr:MULTISPECIES: hypothetical protein [Streptomyces]MBK3384707.1 hypothetical protein [Streptomyces sp. DEF147AK]MBK3389866.1 hypothetical protein [Streptomyces sp. DEF1AK]